MSISWGKSVRYKFIPAGSLVHWTPPTIPAVYAITYKQDPTNKPKTHTVLFFGQAEDLSQYAPGYNRDVIDTWVNIGHDVNDLFIFVHAMPGSTQRVRLNVHEQLIHEYYPDCNRF